MDLLEEYRRANLYFDSGDPSGAARLLEPTGGLRLSSGPVTDSRSWPCSPQADASTATVRNKGIVRRTPMDGILRLGEYEPLNCADDSCGVYRELTEFTTLFANLTPGNAPSGSG